MHRGTNDGASVENFLCAFRGHTVSTLLSLWEVTTDHDESKSLIYSILVGNLNASLSEFWIPRTFMIELTQE